MIPAKANLLENQLRQKVIQFEQSLARISDTRKHLRDNADLVKSEIRATFGTQLTQMRRREQQLLESLDTVASVKDGILSEQQDQLHQALGACLQGLEWYQTAVEDMKENRLSSMDTVEHHINDVLKKLSVVDIKPRETATLSFEADALAIRKAISSFGHVRTGKSSTMKSYESLPAHLEDYEDEDVVHSLLHKAVNGQNKNAATVIVGRPLLSNDPKDWLMREALTGRHSAPLTPNTETDIDQSPAFTKRCVTTAESGTEKHLRQAQVHSWLHHIKGQVENEPHVFEDFEIVKEREINAIPLDSIKVGLADDVTAMFRSYFEAVLLSPSNQWLLKSMEKNSQMISNTGSAAGSPTDFVLEGDMEDMDTCPSTVTYQSSGDDFEPRRTINTSLTQQAYAKLWNQFVDALWSSTDSLWILPCTSQEKPLTFTTDVDIKTETSLPFFTPFDKERRQSVAEVLETLSRDHFQRMKLDENAPKLPDYDRWLLKTNRNSLDSGGTVQNTSLSLSDPKLVEEWLGWKTLLDKVRSMGDHAWLYQPGSSTAQTTKMDLYQEDIW